MQTMYGTNEQELGRRQPAHRRSGRRVKSVGLGRQEKRRLIQLLICMLIFAAVYIGKGVYPQKMGIWKEKALEVLQNDTDFKAAFVGLGQAVSNGKPVIDTLGDMWIEVFGGASGSTEFNDYRLETPGYRQERTLLASQTIGKDLFEKRLGIEETFSDQEKQTETETETGWGEREDVSQPALLEPQPQAAYHGPALPSGCTMEKLSLQLDDTITPVMGVISSGFGYRTHPVDGEYKFHYGVDIAADIGTPIKAFADGEVDYVGKSTIYGNYLQLRHADGVTTFYAHCKKLCIKDGQKVKKGDKIAEVGDTGNATGPHLHFEIRLDGEFLNPCYYINPQ